MATPQTTKAQPAVNAPNANGTTNGSDDRFTDVKTDQPMYNPDSCGAMPLVGYLIDLQPMPPTRDGKEWSCFVIHTTEPVKALDREKNLVNVAKGEEVFLPATHQIRQVLQGPATNDRIVYEVWIKPKAKVALAGGRTMWTWTIRRSKKPNARQELNLLPPSQVRALPPAGGSTADGDDAIPF